MNAIKLLSAIVQIYIFLSGLDKHEVLAFKQIPGASITFKSLKPEYYVHYAYIAVRCSTIQNIFVSIPSTVFMQREEK